MLQPGAFFVKGIIHATTYEHHAMRYRQITPAHAGLQTCSCTLTHHTSAAAETSLLPSYSCANGHDSS